MKEKGVCVSGVACKRGSCKREKGVEAGSCVGVFKSMKREEVKGSMREGDVGRSERMRLMITAV